MEQMYKEKSNNLISKNEWMEEGKKRFGEDFAKWKFKCPSCGKIQSYESIREEMESKSFKSKRSFRIESGKPQPSPYSECTGQDCDWVAYGLFSGPITVIFEVDKPYDENLKVNCTMSFEFAEN